MYQTLVRYREGDGPFGAWLMAVARNHAIDHYRRRKQERLRRSDDTQVLETMPAHGEHPIAGLEREERARPRAQGVCGRSRRTCACRSSCATCRACRTRRSRRQLQIPLGTVKSRINRARVELAKRLLARRGDLATGGDRREDRRRWTAREPRSFSPTTWRARSTRSCAPSWTRHLATCAACRDLREAIGEVVEALRAFPDIDAPAGLAARAAGGRAARAARRSRSGRRSSVPSWVQAAAAGFALIALGTMLLVVGPEKPTRAAQRLVGETVHAGEQPDRQEGPPRRGRAPPRRGAQHRVRGPPRPGQRARARTTGGSRAPARDSGRPRLQKGQPRPVPPHRRRLRFPNRRPRARVATGEHGRSARPRRR